jgi:hypothetical protein
VPIRPLTAQEAAAICRQWVPIGEDVFTYVEQLQAAGFSAFAPIMRFEASYCQSEEERLAHRRYVIERAKQRLGRPNAFPASAQERSAYYSSAYLRELIAKRDQDNGVPEQQLAVRFPGEIWRRELEACGRRRVMASMLDGENFEAQGRALKDEIHEIIAREVGVHTLVEGTGGLRELEDNDPASVVSRLVELEEESTGELQEFERFRFFGKIMDREASRLGFEYDATKSQVNYPVFAKAIAEDWDLCWTIEDRKPFMVPGRGLLHLALQLRHRRLKGPIGARSAGRVLSIPYQFIVPGLSTAYLQFASLREMELIIQAHLCLFGLIAPALERGAGEGLAARASPSN